MRASVSRDSPHNYCTDFMASFDFFVQIFLPRAGEHTQRSAISAVIIILFNENVMIRFRLYVYHVSKYMR